MNIPSPPTPRISPAAIGAGIFLLIGGIIGLAISSVVSQGVAMFNQGCTQIPGCSPESDPSGGIAAVSVIALIIGGVAIAYGARGYFPNSN